MTQPSKHNLLRTPFWAIVLGWLSLGWQPAQAVLVQVRQVSEPAGLLSSSYGGSLEPIVNTGESFTTVQPTLSTNGYVFGYWEAASVRLADDQGRSVTRGTITVEYAITLTAHFFPENQDSDGDGLKDWFEWRNFGGLSEDLNSDSDYDGFSTGKEQDLGQEPTIKDSVEDGGISSRNSVSITFGDTSMLTYQVRSEPKGLITTQESFVEVNATVSTPSLSSTSENNGHRFAYWTMNGVRQATLSGLARNQVTADLNQSTTFVAHFFPSSEDTDSDGIQDWFEYYQFGDLSIGPNDDPDSDSFSNARESFLGQEPKIADSVEDGGISSRNSVSITFGDISMLTYLVRSEPKGLITTEESFVEVNATVSTPSLSSTSENNGHRFAYWTMNGVRQATLSGLARNQVTADLNQSTIFVAHFFPTSEDTDGDEIQDWFEYYQFGNLSLGPNDDPDYDSFSNAEESFLGQEPKIADFVEDGGISSRNTISLLYYLQNDPRPDIGAPHQFALDLAKPFLHTVEVTGQMDQVSLTGNLPPGLSFSTSTLSFSGIPITLGSFTVEMTVVGGTHTVKQEFVFDVLHPPTLVSEILAPDAAVGDYFGASVDLRGSWGVVGANLANVGGEADAGAAYLYQVEANGSASFKQKLVANSPEADAEYGLAVALSPPFLVVGAPKTDANGLEDSGSAYLYRIEDNGSATFLSTLQPESSDRAAGALFGQSVAIDGSRILIGAPGGSSMQGNAFLFEVDSYDAPGSATLISPDDGSTDDAFGRSVTLSGDQFAVGAPGSNSLQGSLYFFSIDGAGTATQSGKSDRGSNASASDGLGHAVALHQSLALGGAPSADSGGAVLQVEVGGYANPLSTTESASPKLSGDEFGHSLAIGRTTGDPIIGIGRPKSDPDGQPNAGSFNLAKATRYPLTAPQPKPNDEFGISGAIDAKRVIVGAWKRDPNFLANAGAVYLFYNPDWGESLGNLFELSISALGPGEVTGAGVYLEDSVASISANPQPRAEFLGWSGSGPADPLASTTTVPMSADRNLTATFALITKDLAVGVQGQGDANGSGSYLIGSTVNIRATPAEGHHFTGWLGSGVANPSLAETTVFMSSDRNLTATFAINQYELSFATSNQGTLTGAGTYDHGTVVSISAQPNSGILFTGWNGEGVNAPLDRNSTVLMTQARNLSANFVNGSTFAGLFMISGGEINEDEPAGLEVGTFAVRANQRALNGFTFSLVADDSGNELSNALFSFDSTVPGKLASSQTLDFETQGSPLQVHVRADNGNGVRIQKLFSLILRDSNIEPPANFTLALSTSLGGSVSGGGIFEPGTQAPIQAEADENFLFDSWNGVGVNDAFASSTTVTMNSDRNVRAQFIDLHQEATIQLSGNRFSENQPSGTEVGSFSVSARQQTLQGYQFSLSVDHLNDSLDNNLFEIDPSVGMLRTKGTLNFEEHGSQLSVFVKAAKGSDKVLTKKFDLILENVNEPPTLVLDTHAFELTENNGTFVTTVSGSDPEQGNLVFGLSTTLDHSLFTMNSATGELAFKNSPDFEKPRDQGGDNSYEIEATLTDGAHLAKQPITVEVIDDPIDTLEIISNGTLTIKEGLPSGSLVTSFSFGGHEHAEFSLIASENSDLHHFFLTPGGDLHTTETLLRKDAEQHLIAVQAKLDKVTRSKKFFVDVIENTLPILSGKDYEERALMVRDLRVVNDPMRTGLNPITKITKTGEGVIVTTEQVHGRKKGDSVVLADVEGLSVNEVKNWNFIIDQVTEKSFRINTFAKADGIPTGRIGSPVTASGTFTNPKSSFLLGPWTFGHLIGNMVGEQDDPMNFLKHFLSQWRSKQTINGWPTDPRGAHRENTFEGVRDSFAHLPFRLLAIGNRLDLFKASSVHEVEDAGEGRFVFCLTGGGKHQTHKSGYLINGSGSREATFIFEYGQKADHFADLARWTAGWQKLAELWSNPELDPSPEYLAHLTEMGDRFSKRGANPDKPNGNSINQVRTNEIVLEEFLQPWQFREFTLRDREDPEIKDFSITATPELTTKGNFGGAVGLWTTTNKGNPMLGGARGASDFTDSPILASWINQRENQILDGEVGPPAPQWMEGGIANQNFNFTFAPRGTRINLARHKFSLSTCSGCHNGDTDTKFTMIKPRSRNQASHMAKFMTGIDLEEGDKFVEDILNPKEKHFYHDLSQREKNMGNLVDIRNVVLPLRMRLSAVDLPAHSDQLAKSPTLTVEGGIAVQWKFELAEGIGDFDNQDFSISSDQSTLELKEGSASGPKTIRIRATALDEDGKPDGTGITLERPYSLFVRKATESTEIEAENFPAFSKVAPPLVTPNPNRVH